MNFLFALGKAYEDRGDYERAWELYRRGNDTHRAQVKYDPVQTEAMNDRILAVFNAALVEELGGAGDPDPSPIFILGLPRSGSTLLEQILATHTDVEGTSELPYVGRLATSLNLNRQDGVNYPEAMRELRARQPRRDGQRLPCACAHAPAFRRAALHRQDAEQLPERGPHRADAAEREDHRRAAPSRSTPACPTTGSCSPRARTSPTT